MRRSSVRPAVASEAAVVTKAVMRAAARLELSNRVIARILGVSEATVSRMGAGTYVLKPTDKSFELGVLFLRLFRALDAIAGGDEQTAREWMRTENTVLGGVPASMVESVPGLINVVGYLDARRALV